MKSLPAACILLVLLVIAGSGCAAARATPAVTFRSLKTGRTYTQKFPQAVFTRNDSGQVEIALTNTGGEAARQSNPGAPLAPTSAPPLRQIMTIRVLWRPMRATADSEASAANAAIEWFILGESSSGAQDRLRYSGTGFVDVRVKGEFATVEIYSASLEPVDRAGELQDPIGRAELSGSILVRRDDALTRATLAEVAPLSNRAAQRDSQPPANAPDHQGPPPRRPSGP